MADAYGRLVATVRRYNPAFDFARLDAAYGFASAAHAVQVRESGEPYIVHPLAVAQTLAELELDAASIIAGMLHDVVEDTGTPLERLEELFGFDVMTIVDGVTKLDNIPYTTQEDQHAENIRKMFLAMAKDIRVVLVKLADRLHNMGSMNVMPDEHRRRKARETLDIYAPLANRLGIFKLQSQLEDLCLMYLEPDAYYRLNADMSEKWYARESIFAEITQLLHKKLEEAGVAAHIEYRQKHLYSIYRKMQRQHKQLGQIHDIMAIRIIVGNQNDCYTALGKAHEAFMPVLGRFKDYIGMPKKNQYQSLHTTLVVGPGMSSVGTEGTMFEVQIRTWDMHRTAELGIAAHWRYKEGAAGRSDDLKIEELRQLIDWQRDLQDAGDFVENVKGDLYADEVFVFSPKGAVFDLPAGSTPIDFAYRVHSAIGNRMNGARVNGRIVPIATELESGDTVEIITSPNVHGPSRDWLGIVKSAQAKSKIRQWFKRANRDENILRGKESVEREMKKNGFAPSALMKPEWVDRLLRRYNFNTMDDAYSAVGYDGISANKLVQRLVDDYRAQNKAELQQEAIAAAEAAAEGAAAAAAEAGRAKGPLPTNGVLVAGIDNCLVRLSQCCTPVPGDDIIGYITRSRGVSVHRADCMNAASGVDDTNRLVEVSWAPSAADTFTASVSVLASYRPALDGDIRVAISSSGISLNSVNARSSGARSTIRYSIEVVSRAQLDAITKRIGAIDSVISVSRVGG